MKTQDNLNDFFISQLNKWELAKKNYGLLNQIKQKKIINTPYPIFVIFNPERIRSTLAVISESEIANRKCFLCKENRPSEQSSIRELDGKFEILVNPYPILSPHFTIAATNHIPQDQIYFELLEIINKYPQYIFFFNGSKSGASAPDHLHLQAVKNNSLPLINYVNVNNLFNKNKYLVSKDLKIKFPFLFFTGKINLKNYDSYQAHSDIINNLYKTFELTDTSLHNSFFWKDLTKENTINYLIIPRKKHRPNIYYATDDTRLLISPGSIEMAGIIVTVNENDFKRTNADNIFSIYQEVAIE